MRPAFRTSSISSGRATTLKSRRENGAEMRSRVSARKASRIASLPKRRKVFGAEEVRKARRRYVRVRVDLVPAATARVAFQA